MENKLPQWLQALISADRKDTVWIDMFKKSAETAEEYYERNLDTLKSTFGTELLPEYKLVEDVLNLIDPSRTFMFDVKRWTRYGAATRLDLDNGDCVLVNHVGLSGLISLISTYIDRDFYKFTEEQRVRLLIASLCHDDGEILHNEAIDEKLKEDINWDKKNSLGIMNELIEVRGSFMMYDYLQEKGTITIEEIVAIHSEILKSDWKGNVEYIATSLNNPKNTQTVKALKEAYLFVTTKLAGYLFKYQQDSNTKFSDIPEEDSAIRDVSASFVEKGVKMTEELMNENKIMSMHENYLYLATGITMANMAKDRMPSAPKAEDMDLAIKMYGPTIDEYLRSGKDAPTWVLQLILLSDDIRTIINNVSAPIKEGVPSAKALFGKVSNEKGYKLIEDQYNNILLKQNQSDEMASISKAKAEEYLNIAKYI